MTLALKAPIAWMLVVVALLGGKARLNAQDKVPEHQVKAAFLFNFAKFIQWPPSAFDATAEPLTIGIHGQNPFGSDLQRLVEGKTIQNRRIIIRESNDIDDLRSCQIVFLATPDPDKAVAAIRALKDLPILTVSDCAGFLQLGGMIRFFIDENKVRFEIKLRNLELAGLSASSKLLKVASVVADSSGSR